MTQAPYQSILLLNPELLQLSPTFKNPEIAVNSQECGFRYLTCASGDFTHPLLERLVVHERLKRLVSNERRDLEATILEIADGRV